MDTIFGFTVFSRKPRTFFRLQTTFLVSSYGGLPGGFLTRTTLTVHPLIIHTTSRRQIHQEKDYKICIRKRRQLFKIMCAKDEGINQFFSLLDDRKKFVGRSFFVYIIGRSLYRLYCCQAKNSFITRIMLYLRQLQFQRVLK